MHLHSLQGKRICILGFGREGQATLRALEKYAPGSNIVIADKKKELGIKNYECRYGEHYLKNLDCFDVVIKSPGIPPSELLTTHYKLLTTPTQIFFDTIADTGTTVIGVTGSKGKSTTSSLIYEILKNFSHHDTSATPSVYLIGNIGMPALDYLDKAKPGVTFVMELSSYQLMDLTISPHIAIITSFFPEHLDYHGSTALSTGGSPLEAYKEAKSNICRFQKDTDIVFYASTCPPSPRARSTSAQGALRPSKGGRGQGEGPYEIAMLSPGTKIAYSEKDAPVILEETRLIGSHNLRNIAGTWKVAEYLGVPRNVAIDAIRSFRPLPHRLQSLGIHHGIEWVDDAISTTPESTIAALDALGNRVVTIILGGLDRGYDFTALAERIAYSPVRTIILLTPKNTDSPPSSSPRIRQAIEATQANVNFFEAHTMEEAVCMTKKETHLSPITYHLSPLCLLSTASPSYTMFKNFEEKGEKFAAAIHAMQST